MFEENNPRIAGRLAELFPDDHYEYREGVWVVSTKGTAKMLYDKLFPDESILDTAAGIIVLRVNSYWGLAKRRDVGVPRYGNKKRGAVTNWVTEDNDNTGHTASRTRRYRTLSHRHCRRAIIVIRLRS